MKKGWPTKTLAEVCQIKPPKSEARETVSASSLVSFLPMEDMGIDVKLVQATQTKPLSAVVGSYTYFADGDVLLAKITPCFENGKLGIADGLKNGIGFGSSEYFVFRPDPTVSKEWLYYFLSRDTFRVEGAARMSGAVGHKRVSKEFIEDYPIPVPPLAEQQRIVVLLDEAFEGLATAKANAEKNLQNARALFESHLQSVFTQRGPGWVEKNLGDLCEVFADGDWVESKDQSSEGIRLIQTGNVGQGVFKDRADKARYISEATFKRLRCTEIFDGDCLISRLPDPVGRSCILPDTGERMITAVDCTIVRFDQKQLLSKFFNHYSQSDDYIRTVAKECTGTTRNRISRSNLALTTIPVPPIAEQKRLASEFDSMREETQRLASLYELKHAALEALKKSLLHQAFTGEL